MLAIAGGQSVGKPGDRTLAGGYGIPYYVCDFNDAA